MTGPSAWRHVTTGSRTRRGNQAVLYGPRGRPRRDDRPPTGEWPATRGLHQLPPETEPDMDQEQYPEPGRIAEVIQAFRDHPESFIADAFPDPPEAA